MQYLIDYKKNGHVLGDVLTEVVVDNPGLLGEQLSEEVHAGALEVF